MTDPIYRTDDRGRGDVRVYGPSLYEFDTFVFVNSGGADRAALLVKLLTDAYRQGYEAAKKEQTQ